MFHLMFVHYTFSSVWVAEWPPFGKQLSRDIIWKYKVNTMLMSHLLFGIAYINWSLYRHAPTGFQPC